MRSDAEVELVARKMAAKKMGLVEDPTGSRLSDDFWRQYLQEAECEVLRSPDMVSDVEDFHARFDLVYLGLPRELPQDLRRFRQRFMAEELSEYVLAYEAPAFDARGRMAKQLDALVDLVYVALGTAHHHGFDFREAWRRVHAANMKKVRVLKFEDSVRKSVYDVVKPPGWVAPDLTDLVDVEP